MQPIIQIIESANEMPICPHCEKEIRLVNSKKINARLGVRYLYYCGACRKVLGVSHRKGFWMG